VKFVPPWKTPRNLPRIASRPGSSYSREAVLPKPLRVITDSENESTIARSKRHPALRCDQTVDIQPNRSGRLGARKYRKKKYKSVGWPDQTHETTQRREGAFSVFSPNPGSRNSGTLLHASHSSDGSGRALVRAAWRPHGPFGSGAPLYGSEDRGVLKFNRPRQGNKSMLGAKRIDELLLPLVQHLMRQHGEVAEYPQQINTLRKLGPDVARSYRCEHPQNTVRQLFDPHGWSTLSCKMLLLLRSEAIQGPALCTIFDALEAKFRAFCAKHPKSASSP
jgi:hypothetical protein